MRKILIAFLLSNLILSCNWTNSSKSESEIKNESFEHHLMAENADKLKRIFFVLPSPVETTLLITKTGVVFQEELLNPTEKLVGYSTSTSRAIALGVYCADLSYSGLNDQYQTSLEYINVTRNIAESLGILKAINQEKINTLENNLTNKELILEIISEIYMDSHNQLKEQERYLLASLMLIGGWIESLYLATQSVHVNEVNHQVLIERILDQSLSLKSVKYVLADNQTNQVIQPIYQDVLELERIFQKATKANNKELDFYDRVDLVAFEQLVISVNDIRSYLVD
jgi:predicted small metal-binding protein